MFQNYADRSECSVHCKFIILTLTREKHADDLDIWPCVYRQG